MKARRLIPIMMLGLLSCSGETPTNPGGGSTPYQPPSPVPTTMTLSESSVTLTLELKGPGAEQSVQLSATVLDQNGAQLSGQTISWASNAPTVASVTTGGLLTAVGKGTATITATAGNASATVMVRVTGNMLPVAMLIMAGDEQVDTVGKEVKDPLIVRVTNEDSIPVQGQIVNWVITAGGGSVFAGTALTDSLGQARESWTLGTIVDSAQAVEARAVDTQSGEKLRFATFTATPVADVPAAVLLIGDSVLSGDAGTYAASPEGNDTLTVELQDQYGNVAKDAALTWSSPVGGGSVESLASSTDSLGRAHARWQLGPDLRTTQEVQAQATVSDVSSSSFTAEASVPSDAVLTRVAGDAQVDSAGDVLSDSLVVALALTDGQKVHGAKVSWSVIGERGSVAGSDLSTDAEGEARAVWTLGRTIGEDSVRIAVDSTEIATHFTATVQGLATSVILNEETVTLSSLGATAQLVATVLDALGEPISGATVTWASSDTDVATISTSGLVTSVTDGTATITATSGSASATASMTVSQVASSVTLSPTSLSFASFADTASLVPTVRDANDSTITGAIVTWASSDTTIATVSSAGLLTSKGNGTATITATSGSVSKTATMTVSQVASSVTLSPTSLSFASFGDTTTITATVKDANDSTIASPTVTWSSSDTDTATVSSAGLVTSIGNGTATITATSGSVSETASVTVTQAAVSITLSADSLDVLVIDTATITARVKDANDSTIVSPTITWTTSSSSRATVSSAGLVTGVAAGTVQIAATHAGLSDTTTVTALLGKSGIISSDETWSTFIKLTDDVKVSDGVTLTIDAGTVIKVTEGADIQVLVEGTLLSQGTSGNEIVFRGVSGSTEKGAWVGIKFRNTTHNAANQNGWVAGSKIEYTKIRNAETGVYTHSQGLYVNNSEFKYNLEAIELRKTDSVYIANSTFTHNNYGVWTEYQPSGETDSYGDFNDAWFNNNTFTSNQTGILIGPNQRAVNNFNFTDNRFENNSSYGIQFGQGGYGIRNDGGAVTFTSNNFIDNGTALGLDHYAGSSGWDLKITSNGFGRNTTALRLEGVRGDTDITSNFFYLNTTTLTSSSQNIDFTFNENIVHQNVDVFLFPANGYQSVQPSITENLIDANSGKILDIKGTLSVLTFEQNVVTGSTFGSAWFYNETSNNFTFSSNFVDWGASTEAEKVYDGSDNFDYGTITFSNHLGSASEATTGRSTSEYAALIAALALN